MASFIKSNPLILMGIYFAQTFYFLIYTLGRDLVTILQWKIWREEKELF